MNRLLDFARTFTRTFTTLALTLPLLLTAAPQAQAQVVLSFFAATPTPNEGSSTTIGYTRDSGTDSNSDLEFTFTLTGNLHFVHSSYSSGTFDHPAAVGFSANDSSGNVALRNGLADRMFNGPNRVTVNVALKAGCCTTSDGTAYTIAAGMSTVVFHFVDDTPGPILSISDTQVDEDEGVMLFDVSLPVAAPFEVTADWQTLNTGTAQAPIDFTAITNGRLTIPQGSNEATLTVAINHDRADEQEETVIIQLSNLLSARFAAGGSTTTATGTIENVAPPTIPTITVDWASKANPSARTCAASAQTNKEGICEGDTIVYTLTATPPPTANLNIRLGRLAAGVVSIPAGPLDYGLTSPNNYVSSPNERNPRTITINAGQATATHEIPTNNGYGSEALGAYYVEITCADNRSNECLTDGSAIAYEFVAADRGQFNAPTATASTNCGSRHAMADGNESSECLVDIHPVPAPTLSVVADSATVLPTGRVSFTITSSTGAPNYYVSEALAPLPITIAVSQGGSALTVPAVTMGVGESTATATITAGTGTADLILTLSAATGYSVSADNAVTVAVETPAPGDSSKPVLALTDDSNGGSNDDNITNDNTPRINFRNVASNAMFSIMATHDGTASPVSLSTTVGASATGGNLIFFDDQANAPVTLADGVWTITATHTDGTKNPATSEALEITIDTVAPTVALTPTTVVYEMTNRMTYTFSEDVVGFAVATGIGLPPARVSNFTRVSGSVYTFDYDVPDEATFTSALTDINHALFLGGEIFQDVAGNENTSFSQLLTGMHPVPIITLTAEDTHIATGASTTITISVSQSTVAALALGDIAVSGGGTLSNFRRPTGTTVYTATFTAGGSPATASISVAANALMNAAGSGNTASNVLEITVVGPSQKPTIALTNSDDSGAKGDNITNNESPAITITNLVGGAMVFLTASHSTANDVTTSAVNLAGNETSLNLVVGALATDGDWTVIATHTEPNKPPADSDPLVITIDTTVPTVEVSPTTFVSGETTKVTFTWSEAVTGFVVGDINVTHDGDFTDFTIVSDTVYTANHTPASTTPAGTGQEFLFDTVTDIAGNTNDVAVTIGITITLPPSSKPTVDLHIGSDTGSENDDDLTNDAAPTFLVGNVASNASVTLTATHDTASTLTTTLTVASDATSAQFTVGLGARSAGEWTVTVAHTEPGHSATDSDPLVITIDTTEPTVTLSPTTVARAETTELTFTWDEDVTG
ncbi:MAG: Ig-like domain-containing protein, partial [Pseudohongiellaceae bacterium]